MGDESSAEGSGRLIPRWPTPIFLDESIQPRVRRAIESVRTDVLHAEMPSCPVARGELDHVWLPKAGKKDWLVVMRDEHIRTRPLEKEALLSNGVRAFVLTGAGQMTMWEILTLLVRRWPLFEQHGGSGEPGPYLYSVTETGVRKLLP